jgi:phosphoribosylformylglycinamidine synthase
LGAAESKFSEQYTTSSAKCNNFFSTALLPCAPSRFLPSASQLKIGKHGSSLENIRLGGAPARRRAGGADGVKSGPRSRRRRFLEAGRFFEARPTLAAGDIAPGAAVKARVYVTYKRGVLDPQGKAVATSLHQLGYREVTDVRIGKFMEVTLGGLSRAEAEKRLGDMCQRLLANTVIEDYRFEFVDE